MIKNTGLKKWDELSKEQQSKALDKLPKTMPVHARIEFCQSQRFIVSGPKVFRY